jgi:competence protein ComEA
MKSVSRIVAIVLCLLATPYIVAADASERAKGASTKAKSSAAKVDLNTADSETLQTLPGVGPSTAQAIIAARPFSSVSDLETVRGIGTAKLAELRPLVTVSRVASTGKSESKKSERAKQKTAAATSPKTSETPKKATGSASSVQGRIDVNTADAATLEELPGVGPATARAIIAQRPFTSVDELESVPGIGPAKLAELREHVRVSRSSSGERRSTTARTSPAPEPKASRPDTPSSRAGRVPPVATAPANEPAPEPTGRATPRSGKADTTKVNLNTATREQLEALPEIGPVKAQAIIDARPFSSIEDVMRVSGIKEGIFEEIKDQITVK